MKCVCVCLMTRVGMESPTRPTVMKKYTWNTINTTDERHIQEITIHFLLEDELSALVQRGAAPLLVRSAHGRKSVFCFLRPSLTWESNPDPLGDSYVLEMKCILFKLLLSMQIPIIVLLPAKRFLKLCNRKQIIQIEGKMSSDWKLVDVRQPLTDEKMFDFYNGGYVTRSPVLNQKVSAIEVIEEITNALIGIALLEHLEGDFDLQEVKQLLNKGGAWWPAQESTVSSNSKDLANINENRLIFRSPIPRRMRVYQEVSEAVLLSVS